MKPFRVAVIAGTSDATDLIRALPKHYAVTAFAATEYGKTILAGTSCTVRVGRLCEEEFRGILCDFDAVADASHPFAVAVTKTVQSVCEVLRLPYVRLSRPQLQYADGGIHWVDSKESAAKLLCNMTGNLLFTTGVNTLGFYETNVTDFANRAWVRILDTPESHHAAEHSNAHLVFGMPPFSVQDTEALLREHQIQVLISKDSGSRGGVPEKIAAARACQTEVILIGMPPEKNGKTIAEIIEQLMRIERGESYA